MPSGKDIKTVRATEPGIEPRVIALVNEAITGDRVAFNMLIDMYQKDIFKMVFYRTRSRMDSEDITQEVFIQAFNKINHLKDVQRFRSWLFSIALNRIRDLMRKKKFAALFKPFGEREEVVDVGPDSDYNNENEPLKHLLKHDFWKQVEIIMRKFPGMEREVFMLRFFDHLSIKEIALILKRGESTIKTHLYRALGKFKKESSMLLFLKEGIR